MFKALKQAIENKNNSLFATKSLYIFLGNLIASQNNQTLHHVS